MEKEKSKRRSFNTSLSEDLYIELKVLAVRKRVEINKLLEEGMEYVIEKYKAEMQIEGDE